MAREFFPGSLVQRPNGDPAPGQAFTLWTDSTSGTNITSSVKAADGIATYTPITNGDGLIEALTGPDGYHDPIFVDTGVGQRFMLLSNTAFVGKIDKTVRYSSVAALLAATETAKGVGSLWEAEAFTYKEAASGASDQHLTTAGGVKLYALPVNGIINLAQLGLSTSTTNITPLFTTAATIAYHIVVPRNASAWNQTTVVQIQDHWIDFEPGARININMTVQAWELTRCKLTNASFTSPYSSALTAGASTTHILGARRVFLGNDCIVENFYQEYAAGGLTITSGSNIDLKNIRIKNLRSEKGWAPGIYCGATAKNIRGKGIKIEDSDRGVEVEDGGSDIEFTNGELINIYPNGYTGQPVDYATYTFTIGAHGHAAGTPPRNVNFDNWRLTNCGNGIDFSTASDSDASPWGCSAKNVRIIGVATLAGQNDMISVGGRSNNIENVSLELGAGINSKMRARFLGSGAKNNKIKNLRAEAYALPLINADDGSSGCGAEDVVVSAAPTTGTGYLFDIDAPDFRLDNNKIYGVTGTSGYVNIDGTAHNAIVDGLVYTVATAETFTNVLIVTGPAKNAEITGLRGTNNATTPPQDIQLGNGVLYAKVHHNEVDRGAGISMIAHSGSVGCSITHNSTTSLSAIIRNDSPTGIAHSNITDYRDTSIVTGKFMTFPNRAVGTPSQLGNNTLRTIPVFVPETIVIDQVGAEITVAGNAGAVFRIGIFPSLRGLPGTAIVDQTIAADAVVANATMATLGASVRLNGGQWYHFGGVTQNAATTDPTLRTTQIPSDGFMILNPATTQTVPVGYSKAGVSGALGAYGTTVATTSIAARIWVRLA
jgi:hypothetical protein